MIEHVSITGTQIGATERQLYTFRLLIKHCKQYHGGVCIGVDEQTAIISKREFGLYCYGHPPIRTSKMSKVLDVYDKMYPPKEYMDRNDDLAVWANAGIVIPKEPGEVLRSGTWATYRRFRNYGRPLALIRPDGSILFENGGGKAFGATRT